MCMITFVPANIDIPWEGIENGSIFNDDGHGWAIASKKGLEVGKSMSYAVAALTLAQAREEHGPDSLVMFHSRFATHGEKTTFNVHPFYVADDTIMAHNGILPAKWQPKWNDKKERRSDTRIFADEVGREFSRTPNGVPSRRGGKQIGDMIGSGNKLVFLTAKDGQPKVRIVNAHQGIFTEGVWYSNSGFQDNSTWNWRYWNKFEGVGQAPSTSASSSSTRSEVGTGESGSGLVFLNKDADCSHCGEINAIDNAARVCTECEFCADCHEYISNCFCYVPVAERAEMDASPLNPEFVTATAGDDKQVALWTPYSGIGGGWNE